MDLKNLNQKLKRELLFKVQELENIRHAQQYYIKNQFNTGRKKGYEDRQKISSLIKNMLGSIYFYFITAGIFVAIVNRSTNVSDFWIGFIGYSLSIIAIIYIIYLKEIHSHSMTKTGDKQ